MWGSLPACARSSADRLHQILNDLHMTGNTQFDPATLRQISESSNADTLFRDNTSNSATRFALTPVLQDLKHDRRVPLKVEAAREKDIPGAMDRLAESIRHNLAVSPEVIKELKSSSFQPTSNSVAALREYNQGIQNAREGKNLEALKSSRRRQKTIPNLPWHFPNWPKLTTIWATATKRTSTPVRQSSSRPIFLRSRSI